MKDDLVEAECRCGKIVLTPKTVVDRSQFPKADGEYTPAARRLIDARLDKALEEVKRGHTAAPFNTADEMIASLKREPPKGSGKKTKARVR